MGKVKNTYQLADAFIAYIHEKIPKEQRLLPKEVDAGLHNIGEKSLRKGVFSDWIHGESLSQDIHLKILKAVFYDKFIQPDHTLEDSHVRFQNAILEYLPTAGVQWPEIPNVRPIKGEDWKRVDKKKLDLVQVLEGISKPTGNPVIVDGWEGIVNDITPMMITSDRSYICEPISVNQIPTCIRWLYVRQGRDLASNPALSEVESIRIAETKIQRTVSEYADRAMTWSKQCPWSVAGLRRKCDETYAAIGILLPLTSGVYHQLRAGEIHSMSITGDGLCEESAHIWVEAMDRCPEDLGGPPDTSWHKLREIVTTFRQLERLTDLKAIFKRDSEPLQVLSLDAHKENAAMLRSLGFKKTNTTMPETNEPLLELVLDFPKRRSAGNILRAWTLFGTLHALKSTGYFVVS